MTTVSATPHRCEHLKKDQQGTLYFGPMNITAELCGECVKEWDARLVEVNGGGHPIYGKPKRQKAKKRKE